MLSHRQIWTHRLMACMTRSYKQAALNTMVVGNVIGELVKHIDNKINNQWSYTTFCIGLSLGAHTCGFIGKSSNLVINSSNCFSTIILFETFKIILFDNSNDVNISFLRCRLTKYWVLILRDQYLISIHPNIVWIKMMQTLCTYCTPAPHSQDWRTRLATMTFTRMDCGIINLRLVPIPINLSADARKNGLQLLIQYIPSFIIIKVSIA